MEIRTNINPSRNVDVREPRVEQIRRGEVWDTADFESYLLAAHDLPLKELPDQIWFDKRWHGLISRTAELSEKDGRERGLHWVKAEPLQPEIARPRLVCFGTTVGTSTEIPYPRLGARSVKNLRKRWGYRTKWPSIVGLSHVHPSGSNFSPGDMAGFLLGWEKFRLMTTKNYLLMFLRSSETKATPLPKSYERTREILKHTVRSVRKSLGGTSPTIETEKLKWDQARQKVAQDLARWSNSALYGGKPGRVLSRLDLKE